MKVVQKQLKELKMYENNPRNNDEAVETVANSIKEFGFKVPMVIDSDNVIICGHTRYKACLQLGIEEVPCIIADDLTQEQVKAFRIAENKTNEYATWDYEKLHQELLELKNIFDVEQFGFSFDDFYTDETENVVEDNYIIPEELEPKAKIGQVYILGNHILMCGDSTKKEDVKKLVGGGLIDLVVTDPPYNVDYGSKAEAINKYGYHFTDRRILNDCMPSAQFIEFLDKAFNNMRSCLKDGGAFYIWHGSSAVYEFEEALRLNSLKARQQLIWVKNSLVLGRQDYQWRHEPCLYGWKDGAGHYFVNCRTKTTIQETTPIEEMKKSELVDLINSIYSEVKQSIIYENKPTKSEEHPTMKPIKLIAQLIANSSRENDKVLDLFGGSGTTLIACEQLNRKCYMMEYDPKYVDVIIDRWEKYTGKKAELL